MKKNKVISILLVMLMLFLILIPANTVFAYGSNKYHPDDWFGYTHSEAEISGWIKDAVKYPKMSEEDVEALKGEIRPGDIISYQVEVEMPTGHEEIMPFLKNFSLNMTIPFGVNAMIEVYASDAPLMTDEEYNQKIVEFNSKIDELSQKLNDETLLEESETNEELRHLIRTYKDLVENRDKYFDIYLDQLEKAKTEYGLVTDNLLYGTANNWMGVFENNPNMNLEEGETYESYRDKIISESYVPPKFTKEECNQLIAEFKEQYPSIAEDYLRLIDEAEKEYENGEIGEAEWLVIINAAESIKDGTFYNVVIEYLESCCDGYYLYENDSVVGFILLAFTGMDLYHDYMGQYCYKFSDDIVQRNQKCTYIFDVNLVATEALSAGNYISIPNLQWFYLEDCPRSYWVSDGFLKGHWEEYSHCNSRQQSFLNFGNSYFANNASINYNEDDAAYEMQLDKRFIALDYIANTYNDENYITKCLYEYNEKKFLDASFKAVRKITIDCIDEYGNIIKTDTIDTYNSYYNIYAEDIYDYQLTGPKNVNGIIRNEDASVTFSYAHKDAEINVSFVDTEGNELAPTEIIKGKTLDEYVTNPAEIPGYELVELPQNASGVLHEDSSDVQYVYDSISTSVIVNYLDINGNVIAESETVLGKMFDEYVTEPKEIEGYRVMGKPNNASGIMNQKVINVFYIYFPDNMVQ